MSGYRNTRCRLAATRLAVPGRPTSPNAENLLVIRDADLAANYTQNWQAHLGHSVPY